MRKEFRTQTCRKREDQMKAKAGEHGHLLTRERLMKEPPLLTSWSWIHSLQNCEKINFCVCKLLWMCCPLSPRYAKTSSMIKLALYHFYLETSSSNSQVCFLVVNQVSGVCLTLTLSRLELITHRGNVFISLDFHNKMPHTRWLKHRNWFPHSSGS